MGGVVQRLRAQPSAGYLCYERGTLRAHCLRVAPSSAGMCADLETRAMGMFLASHSIYRANCRVVVRPQM
jgi:hypothetical protein